MHIMIVKESNNGMTKQECTDVKKIEVKLKEILKNPFGTIINSIG